MFETIGIIFAVFFLLAVFSKMADDQELEKKQIEQELENRKKSEELAREIQRKNHEYKMELKRKADLDPVYQDLKLHLMQSQKKAQQYKVAMIVIVVVALLGVAYLFFKDDRSTQSKVNYESTSSEKLNQEYVEAEYSDPVSKSGNDVLPTRYIPVEASDSLKETQQLEPLKVEKKPTSTPVNSVVKTQSENQVKSSTLSVYEAQSFIGKNTTVCGTVSQISSTSKATYINFGGRYPNQAFSAVIWSSGNELPAENENICVSGLIESYKGTPQIVIQSVNNQISIQ